jgi:hypothetical protein
MKGLSYRLPFFKKNLKIQKTVTTLVILLIIDNVISWNSITCKELLPSPIKPKMPPYNKGKNKDNIHIIDE